MLFSSEIYLLLKPHIKQWNKLDIYSANHWFSAHEKHPVLLAIVLISFCSGKGTMHSISRSGGVIQDTDYAGVGNLEELKEWENSSDCRKLYHLKILENNREMLP